MRPPGMPSSRRPRHLKLILKRWNQGLVRARRDPEVRDELVKHGSTPLPGSREDLARYIDTESKKLALVINERRITVD